MAGKRGRVPRPYPTKDGRWRAALTLDGRRRYLSGRTEREVQRELTALLADRDAGRTPATPSTQTLSAFLADWLADDIAITVPHPGTRRTYQHATLRLTGHLGTLPLDRLTTQAIQRAYREMSAELAPNTVRNIHTTLRRALDTAVAWQLLTTNPAAAAKPPPKKRRPINPLSLEEAQRIIELTAADQYHALWVLLLTTGIRIGEATALTWADVDTDAGAIHIHRTVRARSDPPFGPTKNHKTRTITIDPDLCATLARHRASQRETQLATGPQWNPHRLTFCTRNGNIFYPSQALKTWHHTLARLGIDRRRTHETRHTAATLMLAQGARIDVVQEKLGHHSAAFTLDTYGHTTPAEHAGTTNRLAAALRGKPDPVAAGSAATPSEHDEKTAQ